MQYLKVIILGFTFFISFLSAQNIVTKKYTNENDLDSNEILKIFQDSRQYVWVTTKYGVYVKDMNRFQILKRFNEIKFNNVWDILEDQQHHLWFASYGRGLVRFNGQKCLNLTQKDGLVSDRFRKIVSYKGKIYAGGVNGISIIDPKSLRIITPSLHLPKNQFAEVVNFMEIKGKLYFSTMNHGVFEIIGNQVKQINSLHRIINSYVLEDQILFSSNLGSTLFKSNNFLNQLNIYEKSDLPIIWDVEQIGNNNLWLASYNIVSGEGGVYQYKNRMFKDITHQLNIQSNLTKGIVYDKYNNVTYISTLDQGLYEVYMDLPIHHTTLNKKSVVDLLQVNGNTFSITPNELYVTTEENSKKITSVQEFWNYFQQHHSRFNEKINEANHFFYIDASHKLENIRLNKIQFYNNHLWISSNIGIFEISQQGKILQYLPIHTYQFTFFKNQLIEAHPFAGIKVYDDIKDLSFTYYSEIDANTPTSVVSMDQNSNAVFIGSSLDGLFKFEDGKFTSYFKQGIFKEKKIKLVKCIGERELIVATEFGDVFLFSIHKKGLQLIRKIDQKYIQSGNINLINKIHHKLIIGSLFSVLIIDGDKYYYLDQEQGLDYRSLSTSCAFNNSILIGCDNGFYKVDVERYIKDKPQMPKLLLTGVKINDKKYTRDKFLWFDLIDKNIHLGNNQNNIYIDFALNNPKFPSKYIYRYRLNKHEEWSEYFDEEFIHFNSLKYGKYNIELELTDLNGSNQTIYPLLKLQIDPPFYLTPFFIIGNLLLFSLLIYRFYTLKIKTINEINQLKINQIEEMNEVENKRISLEKKISEIRLLALQGQMNPHFIFNILNSIQYYIIDHDIDNALECLNQFAKLIRKMLDLSSENEISLMEEISFLKLYVEIENKRYKNKVDFEISIDPIINLHKPKFPPMLLQPIIENAFVHGYNPNQMNNKIKVDLRKENGFLIITVEDNGNGMVNNKQTEKFHESKGLNIIRERLTIFNGNDEEYLQFLPNNPGTKVILKFKLNHKAML